MRTTFDRISKYELRAPLARTPTSTVYDAWDSVIARRVALKLMPMSTVDDFDEHEAFARFKRGAQAAGQLNHPNIVAVYDYGETDDYAYLVMEFVSGSTLKDVFDANQRFALAEICRIITSVLEALQYSHDRGVVHRDVKPANIMLTTEKQVKITDFGIARLEDSQITQAGMVIGTPAYMSPEQFLGENIDWRTDVYSTGVVLYQMLTGERPYDGNLATIMHKVLYGSPLLPSRVSTLVTPALDAVVTKAMARNREDRYQTAAEFSKALQAASVATSQPGRKTVPAPSALGGQARPYPAKSSGSSVRIVAVGTVVAALLAAGGWYGYVKFASQTNNTGNTQADADAARLQQQAQARVREEQARQQQEQARLRQLQEAARQQQAAQRQQEEAAQKQQAQLQQQQQDWRREQDAVLQQQQEEARQQQEAQRQRELQAQLQQEAQHQRDLQIQRQQAQAQLQQQQEDQVRLRQQQELARQKREQARQDQEQARTRQAQEQARQKQAQDKQAQEQARSKSEVAETPAKFGDGNVAESGAPRPSVPVTSISGAIGLVGVSVTADTASRFGLQTPQGLVVTGVVTGGAADRAGIRVDDLILKIKGSEISDLAMLPKIAGDESAGPTVPVELIRHGNRRVVQLAADPLRH